MNDSDLKIEAGYRKQGGQTVGMPTVAVKVTHIPTGLTASCDSERSQTKNKHIAMLMIERGLAALSFRRSLEQEDK